MYLYFGMSWTLGFESHNDERMDVQECDDVIMIRRRRRKSNLWEEKAQFELEFSRKK